MQSTVFCLTRHLSFIGPPLLLSLGQITCAELCVCIPAVCCIGLPLVCPVTVVNNGNVRLNSITISEGTCNPPIGVLDLNQTVSCTVEMASAQDHFEAGNMTLAVTVSAVSNSASLSTITAPVSLTIALPVTRQLVLSMVRSDNTTVVDKVDAVVQMTVAASNGGNAHLCDVTLDVPGLENLTCTNADGPVALPADLLVGAGSIVCSGSFAFSQDALEAGSRNFTAGGSAANLGGPGPASNTVEVVVAASPSLQLDVDALNCTKPARMRE
jgi:hypothetical protein